MPAKHVKSRKIQYGDRYSWFAGRAADEAWTQSGLPAPYANPYRSASIIGSGAGGFSTIESAYRDLFILNKRATNPLTLLRIIGSSASAHVGIEYGIKGPTFATCSACSTATHAIGLGLDYIRHGVVDVAVTGASEAVLTYGSMRVWQAMRVLSPDGLLPVLEEAQRHGARRGRRRPRARGARARQEARRQDPGRDRRLRHVVGPQGHGQSRHRGSAQRHADGARRRRAEAVRHRLSQCARHRDHAQRRQRDQRHQDGVRRARARSSRSPRPSR